MLCTVNRRMGLTSKSTKRISKAPDEGPSKETVRKDGKKPIWLLQQAFHGLSHYNAGMADRFLMETKSYVGFTSEDASRIRAFATHFKPHIPRLVNRFYEVLLQHPTAKGVFSGGEKQMERQRAVLTKWAETLFDGEYGESYFSTRYRIGETHVRVSLPQRYMILGMEIIWREFQDILNELKELKHGDRQVMATSLHKLLMLDLTVMLQSYQESHENRIRNAERDAMEAKLLRAEHLAEIGQLAASLAHEIKNPLAGISGAIQIIGDSMEEKNPHREIVHEILGQIGRLDATVKDLLLYARPTPPSPREVKLDSLVPRVLMLLREEPAMRRVRVDFESTNGEGVLFADEGQMEQLLINLILNAAHASEEGGAIQVAARREGSRTQLMVRDKGIGMRPDIREKAMEPFFTTKSKGTGLGLAICRRIVESHNGTISLDSTVGLGTTVSIELPREKSSGATKG